MRCSPTVGFLSAVLLTLALVGRVHAQPDNPPKIVLKKDVVYGKVHGAGLLADIAYPEGKGPFPVILSVHGGRWVGQPPQRPRRRGHRRREVGRVRLLRHDDRLPARRLLPAAGVLSGRAVRDPLGSRPRGQVPHRHRPDLPHRHVRGRASGVAGGHARRRPVPAHRRLGEASERHSRRHQPVRPVRPGRTVVGQPLEARDRRSTRSAPAGLAHPARQREDQADADSALRQRRLGADPAGEGHGRRRWRRRRPRTSSCSTRRRATCASPRT